MNRPMLALRATPQGEKYFGLNREYPSSLPVTKNHQGGLSDAKDESDAKIFPVPESAKCPVKTIKNYQSHLNPRLNCLFQHPREGRSVKPGEDKVWYCNSLLGVNILDSMLNIMSSQAGIQPHLPIHCLRATSVTVLSDNTCNTRHMKSATGYKSDNSIKSYNHQPSLDQKRCVKCSVPSFMAIKPLQLTKRTQQNGRGRSNNSASKDNDTSTGRSNYNWRPFLGQGQYSNLNQT